MKELNEDTEGYATALQEATTAQKQFNNALAAFEESRTFANAKKAADARLKALEAESARFEELIDKAAKFRNEQEQGSKAQELGVRVLANHTSEQEKINEEIAKQKQLIEDMVDLNEDNTEQLKKEEAIQKSITAQKESQKKLDDLKNRVLNTERDLIEDSLEGDTQASFQLNRAAQDRIKDLEEQGRLIKENAETRTKAINDELKADETSGSRIVELGMEKSKIEDNTKAQLESIDKLKKASEEKRIADQQALDDERLEKDQELSENLRKEDEANKKSVKSFLATEKEKHIMALREQRAKLLKLAENENERQAIMEKSQKLIDKVRSGGAGTVQNDVVAAFDVFQKDIKAKNQGQVQENQLVALNKIVENTENIGGLAP